MTRQRNTQGHLVVKNSALSFLQQLIPILLAVATIPYVIHKLGVERFGILALVSVLQGGYANVFDVGMGRATTYFVAASLGRERREEIPCVAFTSLCVQIGASMVAGVLLALLTPLLVDRLLHIAAPLQGETRMTFWLVSASLPLLAIYRNLRSVLEAHQRFDLITALQVPSSSVNRLLPAIGAWAGLHLPGIMVLLIASRLVTAGVYSVVCQRIVPNLWRGLFERRLLRSLVGYGGWVTLCDFMLPIIIYVDRFVIGSVLSVEALGYYAAPFEGISRVTIIPSAIVQALFPALGTLRTGKREQFTGLYAQSMKYTLLLMTPLILMIVLFAGNILGLWVGADFAARVTLVLQLLAVGMLFWGLAEISAALLDAAGRPDVRAKMLFAVGVPSVLLLFLLTKLFGINGAAASWLVAAGVQASAFLWASSKVLPGGLTGFKENGVRTAAALSTGSFAAAGAILLAFGANPLIKAVASFLLLVVFVGAAWKFLLDGEVKNYVFAMLRVG